MPRSRHCQQVRALPHGGLLLMAALPYMQLYVADYLADTMHLEAEEHGAYLLLLMNYWQTGESIPKSRLQRIARVTCNERWKSVQQALSEFFDDSGTHWFHHRVERDLESVMEVQRQRVAAGKASAEARKRVKNEEKQSRFNGRSTGVEVSLNENPTNKDTDQIRLEEEQEKTRADKPRPAVKESIEIPDWIDGDTWLDFVDSRKKIRKPLTPGAVRRIIQKLDGFRREGEDPNEILAASIVGGWSGVFSQRGKGNATNQRLSAVDRVREANRRDRIARGEDPEREREHIPF